MYNHVLYNNFRGSEMKSGESYQLVLQGTALGTNALDLFTSNGCKAVIQLIHWILSTSG